MNVPSFFVSKAYPNFRLSFVLYSLVFLSFNLKEKGRYFCVIVSIFLNNTAFSLLNVHVYKRLSQVKNRNVTNQITH